MDKKYKAAALLMMLRDMDTRLLKKHMPVGLTKIEINRRIEKGQRKNSSLKSG